MSPSINLPTPSPASSTRRQFLKISLLAGAAASVPRTGFPAIVSGGSPHGDIRIAVVGVQGIGITRINDFRLLPRVKVAALCDVDRVALAKQADAFSQRGEKVAAYADYRKLLEDPTIDAVVICTPNHWHALMTIWACQAGKHVYVEKPVSHHVWEGRQAVAAARKYRRIVQAGTQSRSDPGLQEAAAYVRSGILGKVKWARGLCYNLRESIGRSSGLQPVPPAIDYDLWLGPAPLVPPRRNSEKWGSVHYDWHWFWDYGGGDLANQGIHQMDVLRWMLGDPGLPRAVTSFGGRFGYEDDAETPNTQVSLLEYPDFPLFFEVRGLPAKPGMRVMDAYRGIRIGLVIQYEHGYLALGRTGGGVFDHQDRRITQFNGDGGGGHAANFIAAIRGNNPKLLHAPIEGGHLSSALCHLANISYRLGAEKPAAAIREALSPDAGAVKSFDRTVAHLQTHGISTERNPIVLGPKLPLAPSSEEFLSREKFDVGFWANRYLRRDYRPPFVVPDVV